jgi:hypothetical protein
MNNQFKNMRLLTKGMIEFLMDCHEREMMYLPPNHDTTRHAINLLNKKLLITGVYTDTKGKNNISLYTTQLGRDYLSNMIRSNLKY